MQSIFWQVLVTRVKEFDYPEKNYAKLEKIPRDYPYYTKALTEEWPTIETSF